MDRGGHANPNHRPSIEVEAYRFTRSPRTRPGCSPAWMGTHYGSQHDRSGTARVVPWAPRRAGRRTCRPRLPPARGPRPAGRPARGPTRPGSQGTPGGRFHGPPVGSTMRTSVLAGWSHQGGTTHACCPRFPGRQRAQARPGPVRTTGWVWAHLLAGHRGSSPGGASRLGHRAAGHVPGPLPAESNAGEDRCPVADGGGASRTAPVQRHSLAGAATPGPSGPTSREVADA